MVVTTGLLDQLIEDVTGAGGELRRVRDAAFGSEPARQAFFWLGDVILEAVGPVSPKADQPPLLWGITFAARDLGRCIAQAGGRISPARPAIQPGRQIATVPRDLKMSLAVAFMTPHRGNSVN